MLAKILSFGDKFVPIFIKNKYCFFKNLFYSIDNCILDFNKYLFFKKSIVNNNSIINSFSALPDDLNFRELNRKNVRDFHNIPLLEESIILRYRLLNEIMDKDYKIFNNLSLEQLNLLSYYVKFKPFKIVQCDKNLGVCFMDEKLYCQLAFEHLNQSGSYDELHIDPMEEIIDDINHNLILLLNGKNISKQLFSKVFIKSKCNFGKFRVLIKLHKKKLGIRPIVNCAGQPTEPICTLIDMLLKPEVAKVNHILKDSQQVLQQFENMYIRNKPYIYSMDFESLYTNIRPDHAIPLICQFMTAKLKSNHMDIQALFCLLTIVFKYNVFRFKNKMYIQKVGVAMGCKCGPSIANVYLLILENKWLTIHRPIGYYRFIDDILIISKYLLNLKVFMETFVYLKLNVILENSVNFLDLIISYDNFLCKLKFSLFVKPTHNGSYLIPFSNHPSFIFKNIPKSLFIRIRKICSSFIDYLEFSCKLIISLGLKCYDFNYLCSLCFKISSIERSKLLPYKCKENKDNKFDIKTFFEYDVNFGFFKEIFNEKFVELSFQYDWLKIFKPFIIYKIKPNLSNMVIHGMSYKLDFSYKNTSKCLQNCKICPFIYELPYIYCKKFPLPLLSNANCKSQSLVYIIVCLKCNFCYIGETSKALKTRISQHLYNIKRFIPYFNEESEVAFHFRLKGHDVNRDFRVCVFKDGLIEVSLRKSIELDLIYLFKDIFKLDIINSRVNSCKNISALSFA